MGEGAMHPLGDKLLDFDGARQALFDALPPSLRTESVPVATAHGRVTAVEIRAPIDVPSFDRSAMDGYAVRAADTSRAARDAPVPLRLLGAAHAGAGFRHRVGVGECVQIATGAPVPEGADAIVMVERTRLFNDRVWLEAPVESGENISRQGSDLAKGGVALRAQTVLNPARLSSLSALGVTKVTVYVLPKVALVSTGSELRPPGEPLAPGQIYDSNSTSLTTLLSSQGCVVEHSGIVADDPKALRDTLQKYRNHDLVLVTGSSSAGERDYLVETVRNIGSIVFHGVAVKPGKPLLLARLYARPLVGLAGNPASCLMMTYALVVPALRRFQHLPTDWDRRLRARVGHAIRSPKGRRHFVPVRLVNGVAESVYKESDAITSISAADGYIEIPEETEELEEGAVAIVHLF